jgi:hypothetical protein
LEGDVPPHSEVKWDNEFGLEVTVLHVTSEDLHDNPDYAVGILNYAFRERLRRDKNFEDIDPLRERCYRRLERGWIFGEQFGGRDTKAPVREVVNGCTLSMPGKPGRPVTPIRHAAIWALVRKLYLKETWFEVTCKVCPCGDSHDEAFKVVALCQYLLDPHVRFLKRLLKGCDINLSGQFPALAIIPTAPLLFFPELRTFDPVLQGTTGTKGHTTIKPGSGRQWVDGKHFRLAGEVHYFQKKAAAHDGLVRTISQMVFFSTDTGDAWLLDVSDHLAARLARDGNPERPIDLAETDTAFEIGWQGRYHIEGPAFIYTDFETGRVTTTLGYPTQTIAKAG